MFTILITNYVLCVGGGEGVAGTGSLGGIKFSVTVKEKGSSWAVSAELRYPRINKETGLLKVLSLLRWKHTLFDVICSKIAGGWGWNILLNTFCLLFF